VSEELWPVTVTTRAHVKASDTNVIPRYMTDKLDKTEGESGVGRDFWGPLRPRD
jgi:hypothetical protein